MFQKTDDIMTKLQFPWSNCVGFSLDNTSANLDVRNSVKTRVILKNENYYFMGCPCHIIHSTAHKGSVGFTRVTKFVIDEFWIDTYLYFDKSTKRKNALQSHVEFCARISWYFETCKCTLNNFGKGCRKNVVAVCQFKQLFAKWRCSKIDY